jgi:3-oxoacyl-[acyl-carrier protein] reductase
MQHVSSSACVVAIVTGGSSGAGGDVARGLADWAWAVVIVYLGDQPRADAAIAEIIAGGGAAVGVRADLADDLDVERLFTESIAEFGRVDVVAHTTTDSAAQLYQHAATYVSQRGAIVCGRGAEQITPTVASRLHDRAITIERADPHEMLAFLDEWRRQRLS